MSTDTNGNINNKDFNKRRQGFKIKSIIREKPEVSFPD